MINRFLSLPWEAQAILGIFLGLGVLPFLTGWLVVRVYRHFKPHEDEDEIGLVTHVAGSEDGFFKKMLVGWLIWGPILWWFYQTHLA
ncbi:hypothetical protein [Marinicella meishanensis]|uniref:hypothetical protein n=1 Tax=Marinicella meishanensis TaxID=2873263 RepID=UPI001CBBBD20|nr:hypothetical protein [Marinicella sp. NBU2979]